MNGFTINPVHGPALDTVDSGKGVFVEQKLVPSLPNVSNCCSRVLVNTCTAPRPNGRRQLALTEHTA